MSVEAKRNSKLIAGMVIGGLVGTTFSLMDRSTRNNVKLKLESIKTCSNQMVQELKENPSEVKDKFSEKFYDAAAIFRDAWRDGQALYEQIQHTVRVRANDVKDIAKDTVDTYHQSKQELQSITEKLKEAGNTVKVQSSNVAENANLPAVQGNRMINNHPSL
ncbi:MAG: YtxH domain-containing protein [Bacillus sp. (in: firmicutes)]